MPLQWRNQIWHSLEKVPESDARSLTHTHTHTQTQYRNPSLPPTLTLTQKRKTTTTNKQKQTKQTTTNNKKYPPPPKKKKKKKRRRRRRGSVLKYNPVFDWQPVKSPEQWSNMLMSALEKNNFRCVVLNFLLPVHLITVDVKEQKVAAVQSTENKRTQAERWLSPSGDGGIELILLIWRYAERLMRSVCFTIDRIASV